MHAMIQWEVCRCHPSGVRPSRPDQDFQSKLVLNEKNNGTRCSQVLGGGVDEVSMGAQAQHASTTR